jgi:hypothetical protein
MKAGCLMSILLWVLMGVLFFVGVSNTDPTVIMMWFFLHPIPFLIAGYNMRGLFANRITMLSRQEYEIIKRKRAST